jgi:tetratricopeptide (TPR) repeat protein
MQKEKKPESKFFDILSTAEEIHVREVPVDARRSIYASVDKTLGNFEKENSDEYHSFVVQVRNPRPTKPVLPEVKGELKNRARLLESAKLLIAHSELLLARHVYSYILKANIKDREGLEGLGTCLLRLGDPTAAKKCFKALWEIYRTPDALLYFGICLSHEGQDAAALECFQKIQNRDLLTPDLRFEYCKELGNSQTRLGQLEEANQNYQQALNLKPNSDILYVNLGTLELQRKQYDLCQTYFEKAFELNPKNAKAICGVGLAAMSRGDFEGAKTRFEAALDIDSQSLVALNQLFHISQGLDDSSFLKPRLLKFLDVQPKNAEVRAWLATCYFHEGRWRECEHEVDTILEIHRAHPQATKLKEALTQNRPQG